MARGATTLLNLSYDYAGANGKRTGQLTKILNNLNHNKDRGYNYDALGRLAQASGGPSTSPLSTQAYSYDRYGNRTSVTASGYSASLRERGSSSTVREGSVANAIAQPSDPKVDLPTDLLARNNTIEFARGSNPTVREGVSDSPPRLRAPSAPQGGPVFTDDPLIPGVTVIKAVHITELRDAINQARARAGLSAASWAESVTSGVMIKAAHIVELRDRLAEARSALGLSAASYTDSNLAAGNTVKAAHVQELRDRVREALASVPIPTDGLANLSYDTTSNRITTAGFAYDAAGNQTRALIAGGSSQRFQYDAANRLVKVKADDNTTVRATYTYGSSNERLIAEEGSLRTYYACHGSVEYIESGGSTTPVWSKSYVYLGNRLLSTLTPNGSGGESVQYHHPDRLGTRLVTDPSNGTSFEQVTLPFGTALNAESTGATNKRFTSYDRSATTGLDYANNRHYDSQQGRFTQVDPAGLSAASLGDPQSLNTYAYCANDPVNRSDPSGLFWGKLWHAIKKIITSKWFQIALAIAIIVIAHYYPNSIFGFLSGSSSASSGAASAATAPVLQAAGTSAATAAAAGAASGVLVGTVSEAIEGVITLGLSVGADLASLGLAGALGAGVISGAVQEPKIQGRATEEQRAEFKKDYEDLRDRILNRADCAKLFGGATRALNRLARAKITLFSQKPLMIKGTRYLTPARVRGLNNLQINTNGGLFAGIPDAALALGHELGHLLKIYGKDEWDGSSAAMSARNTARVFNACFK